MLFIVSLNFTERGIREIKDDPNPDVPNWGILRADYSAKEAYFRYKDFIANPTDPGSSGCGVVVRQGNDVDIVLVMLLLAPLFVFGFRRKH